MRQIALTASVITFFAMIVAGFFVGQSMETCAIRAIIGAVVSYVLAGLALRLAVDVMIKAVVDGGTGAEATEEDEDSLEETTGEQAAE